MSCRLLVEKGSCQMPLKPWDPQKSDGASLFSPFPSKTQFLHSDLGRFGGGARPGVWPAGSTPSFCLVSHTDSCSFSLHARSGEVMRFTTPGFPDSPYPAHAHCQWVLRGDADYVLSLTFRSFDVAPCDEHDSDLVTVYDTLSPMEPHAVVR